MDVTLFKWLLFNVFELAHTTYKIPAGLSLVVIGLILAISVIASLAQPKQGEQ